MQELLYRGNSAAGGAKNQAGAVRKNGREPSYPSHSEGAPGAATNRLRDRQTVPAKPTSIFAKKCSFGNYFGAAVAPTLRGLGQPGRRISP
jgi:hypothetical protein